MPSPSTIVLATRNPGKVREMKALMADLPLKLATLADFPDAPTVQEDAPTLKGNAQKKAAAIYRHTGLPALADDTGLEVDALGGRPGVHSARYAGSDVSEAANRAHLLQEMAGIQNRTAQFRTVVAFVKEDGSMRLFEGICRGQITREGRGTGGFGYDSLFQPEAAEHTFAELSPEEKSRISHRGQALRHVAEYLRSCLGKEEQE